MKAREPGRGICQSCGKEKPDHLNSCAYSPNHPLRQKAIQDRAAYNTAAEKGEVPVPWNFRNTVELSEEELAEFEKNARDWIAHPEKLEDEVMRTILVGWQIDRVLGLSPAKLKSRSGAQISNTCRGRALDMAQTLFEQFAARKKKVS
jgi:hypothetical protein